MGNEWEDGNDGNAPKALREHADKVTAENKVLKEQNAQLLADNRKNAISGVLTSKGYNPKIAGFVPAELESNEEKITAWLDSNAELFPKPNAAQTQDEQVTATNTTVLNPQVTATEIPDIDRIGNAVALGLAPDKLGNLEAEIANAATPEALDKLFAGHRDVRFT